jgi:hypothetical protein
MGAGLSGGLQWLYGAGTDEELYGKKVVVPDYPLLEQAQRESIKNNKAVLPDAMELASSVDVYNQKHLEDMLRATIPDIDNIKKYASQNISSMVKGEVPQEIQDLISRTRAEKGIAGGFAGSGMQRNLESRDLGLTSLEMTQKGLSSAERWMDNAKRNLMAPFYDVTSQFVTPMQQFAANDAKFQRDLYAAQMEAAPDPAKRGAWDTQMTLIGEILSIYGGGAGYGGTYRGNPTKEDSRDTGPTSHQESDQYMPSAYSQPTSNYSLDLDERKKDWSFSLY